MGDIFRFADFELDRGAYQLRHKGGDVVPLEPVPLDLLFLLAEKPGRLLTRDEIYERIWGKNVFVDAESAINTAIRKVRRALNDNARKPQFVFRVPGKGYRFTGVQQESPRPTSITASTKFVGREREMGVLRDALSDTVSGRGRFVLISGEPGIGKSRICVEIADDAERNGMAALIGHCVEQDTLPYLPFVEILESYIGGTQNPDELRRMVGDDGPELALLVPKLRRLLPDLPQTAELGSEQARRQLFSSICEFIARRSQNQPTLLILEDLHWSDDSTLALIGHLSQHYPKLPLAIIATYRAHKVDLNPSLTKAVENLVRARQASEIRLVGLASGEVALMLQELSGRIPPFELTREFCARTEGNPFFVEELFRHFAEENRLYDTAGDFRVEPKINDLEVPRNVGLVVGRRLARLREATNKILAAAAVIGRSFSSDLLVAATGVQTELLLDCLDEAECAGLIRSTSASASYRTEFSHELTRGVILSQLSTERRKQLHLTVAAAIERIHSNCLEDHYAGLAQHYAQTSETQKAMRYLYLAGQQAMKRSAHAEAARLLTSSLDLLKSLPETDERDQQELASRIALAASLSATKGLAASGVESASLRAVQLSRALGETQKLFWAQCLLTVSYFMRARMQKAQELAKQLVDLAEGSSDAAQLFLAHALMGQSSFWLGQPALGHRHLERAIASHNPYVDRTTTAIFGYHPIVPCLSYEAEALWFLGYPHRALDSIHSAETLAQGFDHPNTIVVVLEATAWLHVFRREAPIVLERSERAIALANEHGFAYHAAQSAIMKGWALVQLGHEAEGIAQIEIGLVARKATGAEYPPAQFLGWLAEAYGKTGQQTKALSLLERALATIHRAGDPMFEAELHRLKGELLLLQDSSNVLDARRCFRTAIEMSARQGAKSLEIRATTSLARLLTRTGCVVEARTTLAEIYNWFTEGFDTADLKEAKAVLEELST